MNRPRPRQRGVALIITLIMLSVVLLMMIVFLGISRRERTSVGAIGNLTDARLAADAGFVRAQAELLGRIAANDNLLDYDYFVSTNYINPAGFVPGLSSFENVSYVYAANGQAIGGADLLQNLTNLFLDPRVPVFAVTNRTRNLSEWRYYLDLNRNGVFDTNGVVPVFSNGRFVGTNFLWGDPEWIAIFERSDLPHSATNRAMARYAFAVLPAGKSLDINFVHNRSKPIGNPPVEGFNRNQGVGSWELNLAAFLRTWLPTPTFYDPLQYLPQPESPAPNQGLAFGDAAGIIRYRYHDLPLPGGPRSVLDLWAGRIPQINLIQTNSVDYYADDIWTGGTPPPVPLDPVNRPWPGADNYSGFATVSDFFDSSKTRNALFPNTPAQSLAARLLRAGTDLTNTTNRYAFYRLISQMGTDSIAVGRGKVHLNFTNGYWASPDIAADGQWILGGTVTNGRPVILRAAEENLVPWTLNRRTRQDFFMLAADSIVKAQFPRDLPNGLAGGIPIYPTNFYSGALHRSLQLAANLLDANVVSDRIVTPTNGVAQVVAPSVFRPIFRRAPPVNGITVISIAGYEEVNNMLPVGARWLDLTDPAQVAQVNSGDNIHGVPWVIGAKKHWPNFNEFYCETTALIVRRLQATRNPTTRAVTYRQGYEIAITNLFGLESWNAYTTTFTAPIKIAFTNIATMALVDSNRTEVVNGRQGLVLGQQVPWRTTNGFTLATWAPTNYFVATNLLTLVPRGSYLPGAPVPLLTNTAGVVYDPSPGFRVPNFKLEVTNRFLYLATTMINGQERVVDLVTINPLTTGFDIQQALTGSRNVFSGSGSTDPGRFWQTNRLVNSINAPTAGITNQIFVSTNALEALQSANWIPWSADPVSGDQVKRAIDEFRVFHGMPPIFDTRRTNTPALTMQVPFTPGIKLVRQMSWQANDPMVHYHYDDLFDHQTVLDPVRVPPNAAVSDYGSTLPNLYVENLRYSPWGGKSNKQLASQIAAYNPRVQDPGVRRADDWEFPQDVLPHVGHMGRIHRGTPWQTVYLKAGVEKMENWLDYAGETQLNRFAHPTNDWLLLDIFTAALTENATRGLLGVNQTNAAAWAAVLGGVRVQTNAALATRSSRAAASYGYRYLHPETPEFARLVEGINTNRVTRVGGRYSTLGDLLSAPVLSDASPFLSNLGDLATGLGQVNDAVYEGIPQQILGLLKADEPYFVVYSYGQALQPAERSLVLTPGPYFNLCTNYQVTGEVLTKTSFRIERRLALDGTNVLYNAVIDSFNVLPVD